MQDFHFVMRVNKASPKLLLACATGEHIPKAVLTCRKAGTEQQEYLIFTFTGLLVSSYQTGGSKGDVIPVDQISLNYTKIECEYKPQDEKGKRKPEPYDSGTWGPASADAMLARDGRVWRRP